MSNIPAFSSTIIPSVTRCQGLSSAARTCTIPCTFTTVIFSDSTDALVVGSVLAEWAWVYFRNERGARLITGDVHELLPADSPERLPEQKREVPQKVG